MKIALVAGRDNMAVEVAKILKSQGNEVDVIAFEDSVCEGLAPYVDSVHRYNLTQIGAVLKAIRNMGSEKLIFAGKFHKVVLDKKQLKFDLKALWMLARLKDRRDDTIMRAIVDEIEKMGVEVMSQADVIGHLFISEGVYTATKPTKAQMEDVEFGYGIAKTIAGMDIGQTVIIKNKNVVAVEASEGTDGVIKRSAELVPKGGFTAVKVAKPDQDYRLDVPVVGMTTFENLAGAGGAVIAVEAGKTYLMDEKNCIEYLNKHNIVLMGYKPKFDPNGENL